MVCTALYTFLLIRGWSSFLVGQRQSFCLIQEVIYFNLVIKRRHHPSFNCDLWDIVNHFIFDVGNTILFTCTTIQEEYIN